MATDQGLKAIALNNSGAHHLRSQNYVKAIAFFRNAVVKAKVVLQRSISDANTSQPHQLAGADITLETMHLLSTDDEGCSHSSQYSFETDESLLCMSAIAIHHTGNETSSLSVQSVAILSMSAIYNIAIAHHLCGLRQRSRDYLHKAKNFYEIAFELMHQQQSVTAEALPCMCVLNNLASLHHLLGDTVRSILVLKELLVSMQRLDCTGRKLSNSHWRVFWSNLLRLSLRNPISAAAA